MTAVGGDGVGPTLLDDEAHGAAASGTGAINGHVDGSSAAGPDVASAAAATQADLPHTAPLAHDNALLSPALAPDFDVDAFLVSRTPASTLANINTELVQYGDRLDQELGDVVDRDFRGFVNLGTALKAEGPRIARLDWKVPHSQSRLDATVGDGPMQGTHEATSESRIASSEFYEVDAPPRDVGSNLGLERIRTVLISVRDDLRSAEEAMRDTMASKEAVEKRQEDLKILLSLEDSLRRLEGLLLPGRHHDEHQGNSESDEANHAADEQLDLDQTARFWKAFTNVEIDEGSESDTDASSTFSDMDYAIASTKHSQMVGKDPAAPHTKRTQSSARRRSSAALLSRQRSFTNTFSAATPSTRSTTDTALSIPTRIARAGSEHDALMFLMKKVENLGFLDFVQEHAGRIQLVRDALKQDLERLIRALVSPGGASLLVPSARSNVERTESALSRLKDAELESWSQVKGSRSEKQAEQVAWLELALSTWSRFPTASNHDGVSSASSEVETVVREALVQQWAQEVINPLTLTGDSVQASSDMNNVTGRQITTIAPQLEADDIMKQTEGDVQPLTRLYNSILSFVANEASQIVQIADRIVGSTEDQISQSGGLESSDSGKRTACNVFARSVWRGIATRLMEQLGGHLFFVGRTQDFHRNYTVSMAFVDAFERLAPSSRALAALRDEESYSAFKKRWQLPVYFQMRLRETITALEGSLTRSKATDALSASRRGSSQAPLLSATQVALDSFAAPWKRGRHIAELSARQWRLSLQIASRFRAFIQEEVPREALPAHRRAADVDRSIANGRSTPDLVHGAGSGAIPGIRSPSRAGTPTGSDPDGENVLIAECTAIAVEMLWYEDQVLRAFDEIIAPRINDARAAEPTSKDIVWHLRGKLSRQSTCIVRAVLPPPLLTLRTPSLPPLGALQSSLSLQRESVPLLAAKVTAVLKSRCAEPLRLVRSLSSQYRSAVGGSGTSSNPASLDPSYFVNQFLRPLRMFLGRADMAPGARILAPGSAASATGSVSDHHAGPSLAPAPAAGGPTLSLLLPKATREQWVREVVEDFVARYTASLQTMNKNFESLQRLKRVNASGSNADGVNSAAEAEAASMHAQMTCDVKHLERELHDLRLIDTDVPTDTPAWRRLREAANGTLDE